MMTRNEAFELLRYFGTEENEVWRFSRKNIDALLEAIYTKGRQSERKAAVDICLKVMRDSNLLAEDELTETGEAVARGSAIAAKVIAGALSERVI